MRRSSCLASAGAGVGDGLMRRPTEEPPAAVGSLTGVAAGDDGVGVPTVGMAAASSSAVAVAVPGTVGGDPNAGHQLEQAHDGSWRCVVCFKTCKHKLWVVCAPCPGRRCSMAGTHQSHRLWQAGRVVFCAACVAWSAGGKTALLASPCLGRVRDRSILNLLREGRHPKSKAYLGSAPRPVA